MKGSGSRLLELRLRGFDSLLKLLIVVALSVSCSCVETVSKYYICFWLFLADFGLRLVFLGIFLVEDRFASASFGGLFSLFHFIFKIYNDGVDLFLIVIQQCQHSQWKYASVTSSRCTLAPLSRFTLIPIITVSTFPARTTPKYTTQTLLKIY